MTMRFKGMYVPLLILLSISGLSMMSRADGCIFADIYQHVYEPDQKAIVRWNGTHEQLVLAVSIRSERISDVCWVVPLPSRPVVENASADLFFTLAFLMSEGGAGKGRFDVLGPPTGDVTVLEFKEIDVYDITVLEARGASDLHDWLLQNGYMVPKGATEVFECYQRRGWTYYVAVKVDLRNDFLKPAEYPKVTLTGIRHDEWGKYVLVTSGEGVWFDTFSNNDTVVLVPRKGDWRGGEGQEVFIPSWAEGIGVFSGNCFETYEFGGPDGASLISRDPVPDLGYLAQDSPDVFEALVNGTVEEAYRALSDYLWSSEGDPRKYAFLELTSKLGDLMEGMGVPLSFTFETAGPVYPLEISSINSGDTHVEVYVISPLPLRDRSRTLRPDGLERIDEETSRQLVEFGVGVSPGEFVARLVYDGPSQFSSDSYFYFSVLDWVMWFLFRGI